jgi:ribosomal small subunit protein bTHX
LNINSNEKSSEKKSFYTFAASKKSKMGKGDIKSKKGKMANGSFGKTRLRNETMPKVKAAAVEPGAKTEKSKSKKAEK